ncbi:MAG TPA: lysoplasmalogenase [Flavobacteriales bacterium]|nr:lysoplasmalogenase [Flavobacteriales bacterium]
MDPRKNNILNGAAYGLATLGTIVGQVTDLHVLVYVCKPAMMVTLSSWFFFNSRRVGDRFTLLIQAGLFFSLVGDIALMLEHLDEFNFLIGLGAFLVAQLCYTMAFAHNLANVGGPQGILVSIVLSVGLVAYGYFFAGSLLPKVDESIMVPVAIYAVVITLMGIGAAFRFGRTFMQSFLLVFIGALLFIASDSVLAINRFSHPLAHAGWSVLLTYALAQALIAAGSLQHVLDPEEIRRRAALAT